jgi:hypothetical protein
MPRDCRPAAGEAGSFNAVQKLLTGAEPAGRSRPVGRLVVGAAGALATVAPWGVKFYT